MEGDRRRRASRDARLLHVDDEEPLFPLDKETMISFLQPVSAASLLCISVGNVACSQNTDGSANPHLTAILASFPYAFLPFGLAGLAAATAAKTKTHLGRSTMVFLVATVLGWSYACSYPKFLRCIWTNVGRSQKQLCPSCRAAETSVVSPSVEGFTDLGPVKTSGHGDEAAPTEARELIVTNPMIAHLITLSSVIFSVATTGMFVYIAYLHFKIHGPLWEAVVSCAAESPLFVVPLCMVPRLRDAFISIYATGLPDSSSSDLNTRLLASEIV